MTPEQIISTYDAVAEQWNRERNKALFERAWLDRWLNVVPPPRRVLDLGCGSGLPIARYLVERRSTLTGVDASPAMIALFRQNVPAANTHLADMRDLDLGAKFDGILAWNSFFHLTQTDQRAMFRVFADHASDGAALMFTAGPEAGEAMGTVGGKPIYHASLSAEEYRSLLAEHGFEVLKYVPEDPDANMHTIWLARFTGLLTK